MKSLSAGEVSFKPAVELNEDLKDGYFMSFIVSFQAADALPVEDCLLLEGVKHVIWQTNGALE